MQNLNRVIVLIGAKKNPPLPKKEQTLNLTLSLT